MGPALGVPTPRRQSARGAARRCAGRRVPPLQVRAVHEAPWGEVGMVICWVEQGSTLGGVRQQLLAPTTVVLRRVSGAWRMTLFHSIPLPQGAGG